MTRSFGTKTAAILLALGVVLPACAEDTLPPRSALEYAEHARRDYELGLRAFEGENWETAAELLNDVRKKYGYSRYARLAELRLADADLAQEKFAEAVTGYKSFIHDYPNDPEVPYARFRVAKAQYDSVSQSFMMPPLEERDLAAVNDALVTITQFLGDYPKSPYSSELRYMHAVVVGLLARHELYVARFYLGTGNFDAAVLRCEHALKALEHSGLEAEALVLLGETYLKQKEKQKAHATFTRVLTEHPSSPFVEPARRFLAILGPVAPKKAEAKPSAPSDPSQKPAERAN